MMLVFSLASKSVGEDEDVAVQTGDAIKPINRDFADFAEIVNPSPTSNRLNHSPFLGSLTSAGTRTKNLDDGPDSNGGKAIRDGADGKFLNSILQSLHPTLSSAVTLM